ncbi:hypothetical protein M218_23310 [Burkholderia pseudomallei MSHR338]|nr:hypothetical protein M218_23310 [Burkholderia pseudomallei MSHR338]KGX77881.1 hypothetical protein Y033_3687 [Burkholderia pseudomallei MSHR435]OAG65022.1 hypothetical protein BIM11_5921 [Burkholderia pseudomallei]
MIACELVAVTAPAATPDSSTPPVGPEPATLLIVSVLPFVPPARK